MHAAKCRNFLKHQSGHCRGLTGNICNADAPCSTQELKSEHRLSQQMPSPRQDQRVCSTAFHGRISVRCLHLKVGAQKWIVLGPAGWFQKAASFELAPVAMVYSPAASLHAGADWSPSTTADSSSSHKITHALPITSVP